MRIPEENCNMILLAAVTLVSTAIVGGMALLEPAPAQATAQAAPSYLMDTTPVRVVGAPFVPNTDPHRR
jgi:hypothetical protein